MLLPEKLFVCCKRTSGENRTGKLVPECNEIGTGVCKIHFRIFLFGFLAFFLVDFLSYLWCLHLGGALSRCCARFNCEINSSVLHASCPL